jgi:predicted TIM-barrel fold metal-dependent hydrolase
MAVIRDAAEIALDRPKIPLPDGAWDCHAHVFGPFADYPLLEMRRYDPPEGGAADYMRMLDTTGFRHGVLVHASAFGYDNRCTEDAVHSSDGRVVGVGAFQPTVSDAELQRLHAIGFRSMRFTVTDQRARIFPGALDFGDLEALAPRFRELGWHAQVWANCADIVASADLLSGCGIPVVFDHLGYQKADKGTSDPDWHAFVELLANEDFWVKLTTLRIAADGFFDGARPFHDAVLEAAPNRALFGTDWPYIGRDVTTLTPARQVDIFDAWTNDEALRQKVFVDNPGRLFGVRSAAG